ncbi:hypothetical protein [Streptomyces sp. NPDC058755]|uniref:hypothetical protein n=1 Tax=Streptomyces sp. NPDC058755 TaxID=3346624 RepID=UPI0036C59C52
MTAPDSLPTMSGLGTTRRDYAASCRGAAFADGLAIRGEEVTQGDSAIRAWLERVRLVIS